jgi:hypothetical protein
MKRPQISKSKTEKREFKTWFQRTNLEREQAGLRPLPGASLCSHGRRAGLWQLRHS